MSDPAAEIHLACAAAGAYDAHSAVLLRSAALNTRGSRLRAHFLHGPEHPRRSREAIARMLDELGAVVDFHEIPVARTAGLPVLEQFTVAMWYRMFLPELVPADRVLYVDSDAVVADALDPLWRTDLEGVSLAAVTNVFQDNHLHRPMELGLPGPDGYFNSGVLLMNLDRIRADDSMEDLREMAIQRGAELGWPDQDALNLVFEGRWRRLHPRWNAMNSLRFPRSRDVFGAGAVAEARRSPGIRHFEGPGDNKPWHFACERDQRELYLRHRRGTPWPRLRPSGSRFPRFRLAARGVRSRVVSRASRRRG